jgi:hypothetical protein
MQRRPYTPDEDNEIRKVVQEQEANPGNLKMWYTIVKEKRIPDRSAQSLKARSILLSKMPNADEHDDASDQSEVTQTSTRKKKSHKKKESTHDDLLHTNIDESEGHRPFEILNNKLETPSDHTDDKVEKTDRVVNDDLHKLIQDTGKEIFEVAQVYALSDNDYDFAKKRLLGEKKFGPSEFKTIQNMLLKHSIKEIDAKFNTCR